MPFLEVCEIVSVLRVTDVMLDKNEMHYYMKLNCNYSSKSHEFIVHIELILKHRNLVTYFTL